MAIRKLLLIALSLLVCLFQSTELFSQYNRDIQILDFACNKPIEININEDWGSQTFVLATRNRDILDSSKVCNVQEIDSIYTVENRFLIINYRIRAGSGEHLMYTNIYSVKNGSLFECLSLSTRQESFSPNGNLERGYSVVFTIKNHNNNYYIFLLEEEIKRHKSIFIKQFKLIWNENLMIFYSSILERNNTICIDDKSIKVNNDLFKVCLKKESYFFYNKVWYQRGRKGCFYRNRAHS